MLKLYRCKHCGNIVEMVKDSGVNPVCCGEPMEALNPNTTDAAQEKHVPVVEQDGNCVMVKVGSVAHPMQEEHHIAFVILETNQGIYKKFLDHNGAPEAAFMLSKDEKPVAAYEYCNLHGFWKAEI